MGTQQNITHDRFPAQGSFVGKRVHVCFHYDTSRKVEGTIVRDDGESPNVTIIRLDDGRHVLATECQYGLKDQHARAATVRSCSEEGTP